MSEERQNVRMAEGQERLYTKQQEQQRQDGSKCPSCGADIPVGAEFCPECGNKLVSYCTFCGASLKPSDRVCPECENPVSGIVCPKCGTRNHRLFCRQCNEPLNRAAMKAVERRKQDPKIQEAVHMTERLLELEELLEKETARQDAVESASQDVTAAPTQELSPAVIEMLTLLGKPVPKAKAQPKVDTDAAPVEQSETRHEYDRLVQDINKLFEELLPPAGSTPQQQRVFLSACKKAYTELVEEKITIKKKSKHKVPVSWTCNYCGCTHNNPSECCRPELGGTWTYLTITQVQQETQIRKRMVKGYK